MIRRCLGGKNEAGEARQGIMYPKSIMVSSSFPGSPTRQHSVSDEKAGRGPGRRLRRCQLVSRAPPLSEVGRLNSHDVIDKEHFIWRMPWPVSISI